MIKYLFRGTVSGPVVFLRASKKMNFERHRPDSGHEKEKLLVYQKFASRQKGGERAGKEGLR